MMRPEQHIGGTPLGHGAETIDSATGNHLLPGTEFDTFEEATAHALDHAVHQVLASPQPPQVTPPNVRNVPVRLPARSTHGHVEDNLGSGSLSISRVILILALLTLIGLFAWQHLSATVLALSVVFTVQALFALYLMLYSWEEPDRLAASAGPTTLLPPRMTFTVLLPARHEETVIRETITRVWAVNYPAELMEVVVICHASDTATIAEAQRVVQDIGSSQVRVETFNVPPINKPHGLNVGLERTSYEVVTIFDAEDDIDADIFNVINTVMLQEKVGIVQAGVQLMNYRDHWFSIHNCLEYYFWFKSRLHYHAKVGMIPLGGNTVFIRRDLLDRIGGWDASCLTEDAEVGIRLSALGETIRVVYDAQHVTREETPCTVAEFVKQRTRWQQGFLQVLFKGTWWRLPRLGQRALAAYTLSYPFLQSLMLLQWPCAIAAILWLDLSTIVTMASIVPLYVLLFQSVAGIVGAYLFTREYGLTFPLLLPVKMALTFLPFNLLLGVSGIRAVYREVRRQNNWEKTAHQGAHRRPQIAPTIGGD